MSTQHSLTGRPIARGLRFLGAALILLNGGVHLLVWGQAYRSIPVIGPLFLANAVAALLIAAALVWRPEGIAALLGLGLSVGTFGAFLIASMGRQGGAGGGGGSGGDGRPAVLVGHHPEEEGCTAARR